MNTTPKLNPKNRYELDQMADGFSAFAANYPSFHQTKVLDEWRETQYSRLDANGQIYLDYTGGGLYSERQISEHMELLRTRVLGNPHSANPTSLAMTDLVEDTRKYVLGFFNAAPDEYIAIFTANATGALKLVGEAYPFTPASHFVLTFDNHNSVNGIREFAKARGAQVTYVPVIKPDLRIDRQKLDDIQKLVDIDQNNLFAFPAQSNYSGVKHSLDLVQQAQSRGFDVLLDAAAYVPTNRLDLGVVKPEFVTISFYKMFGYPTGIGALLIRRAVFKKMKRPWFAGGTVNFASVQGDGHYLAPSEAAFEDGTVNYLNIPAIKTGLQHLEKVGIDTIGQRVHCITGWLLDNLLSLQHSNGKPMVRIYGPIDTEMRGGTITLNFYGPDERLLDYRRIEELANAEGISLRTGCFCNPGAGEISEGLTAEDMRAGLDNGPQLNLPHFLQVIQHRGNKSAGAIRISVGLATNFADAYRFMHFAAGFRDKKNMNIGEVTFDIQSCRVIRDGS